MSEIQDRPVETIEENEELRQKLIGTWELISYQVEEKETGAFIDAMGSRPRGRVIFTEDGWVAFNLEGTGREPATDDASRAALMKSLVAYIGRFRVEGDQWITTVESSWAPEWVGTEQHRNVSVNGEFAEVTTPWRNMPNWAHGRLSRSIIQFRRAQPTR